MPSTRLIPEKITSPIQLMAAWFVMLVLLVSVLLTAASKISKPDWAAGYLVIFTTLIILVVIGCVLLMLTKFRPNLQEGKEYAQWLKDQNSYSSGYLKASDPKQDARRQAKEVSTRQSIRSQSARSFLVNVLDDFGGEDLVEALKGDAFNAELYEEKIHSNKGKKQKIEDHACIWVGSRISPNDAISVIKLAVSHWPHLKYLHLSSDGGDPPDYVHDEIFLGGATSTAERYGLQPWSTDELLNLDETMTAEAFHAAVRGNYS